jgi:nucleoside-diphosphate-sugar epimerase
VAVTGGSAEATALLSRLVARADRPVVGVSGDPAQVDGVEHRPGPLPDALAGVACVVHLDASRDPAAPAPTRRAHTMEGTAALLDAARPAGVRRVVLVTSVEVLRPRPGQVPVPERAPVRAAADDTLVGDWVEVERLADHARRTGLDVVVLRPAAVVGPGVQPTGLLRSLAGPRLLAVRGVEPLWQLCHADDLVAALEIAATGAVRGAVAVASTGWLLQSRVESLTGRRRLELPSSVLLSTAERLHRLGVTPGSPAELDGLLAPVVVEATRLRAAGWTPAWSNEDALLAHVAALPAPDDRHAAGRAAGAAGATAAVLGTAALVRRARRRRRGR